MSESLPEVQRIACARIPTEWGEFQLCLYTNNRDEKEHLAVIYGDITGQPDLLVRVHSECFTGDVLGSKRCDCGEQLELAMRLIVMAERGVLLYLRQEGRGIGLAEKLRAYNLQDEGYDTVDANILLGHQADMRDYGVAVAILRDLEVPSIRLLTNNPAKIKGLEKYGLKVNGRVPLQIPANPENKKYLKTKAKRMHHLLDFPGE